MCESKTVDLANIFEGNLHIANQLIVKIVMPYDNLLDYSID